MAGEDEETQKNTIQNEKVSLIISLIRRLTEERAANSSFGSKGKVSAQ